MCSVWHHTHFVMRKEPDHFFTTNIFTSGFIRLEATSVQLEEDHHDVLLCHHAHDVMRKEPDESFTAKLFTSNLCGYYHGFKSICIISCVRGHAYDVMRRVPDCFFSFVLRTHFVMREESDDCFTTNIFSSDVSAYKPHWFNWFLLRPRYQFHTGLCAIQVYSLFSHFAASSVALIFTSNHFKICNLTFMKHLVNWRTKVLLSTTHLIS